MLITFYWLIFKVWFFLLPLGLPGGDLVDGLPPAASCEARAASEFAEGKFTENVFAKNDGSVRGKRCKALFL